LRTVEGVPAAYLEISGPAARGGAPSAPPVPASSMEYALVEIARANCDAIKTMSERFSGVMDAASTILRAADAAGLPRRKPTAELDDDEDDEDDEDDDDDDDDAGDGTAQPTSAVGAVISQIMTAMSMVVQMRGGDVPKMGALLGKGNELKVSEAGSTITSDHPPAAKQGGTAKERKNVEGSADPMGHFLRIQAELTPAERALVQRAITKLAVSDLMQWRDQLAQLSVADAVAVVRAELTREQDTE
jgi:hypothetical protein